MITLRAVFTAALSILVLAPDADNNIPVNINRHIQNDGSATDLAVLNVALLGNRIVDQDGDGLTAVRATDCLLCNFGHGSASVARLMGTYKPGRRSGFEKLTIAMHCKFPSRRLLNLGELGVSK